VGGTPLYLKGLLRGIFEGPPADWEFRQQVQEELERAGPSAGRQALHQRLEQVDPLSAHKLHPNDTRRVIRALEVHRVTGQPISHHQLHFEEPTTQPPPVLVLDWPREQLHQRIADRVDWMFAEGLVGEVEGLLDKYGELSRTASQAVGYREVMDHLQQQVSSEQMIEMVAQRTRQFARRQETWLRSVPECQRVAQLGDVDVVAMAGQLEQLGRQRLAERTAGENPS
jgi:tRNA dimethylallyltransferase